MPDVLSQDEIDKLLGHIVDGDHPDDGSAPDYLGLGNPILPVSSTPTPKPVLGPGEYTVKAVDFASYCEKCGVSAFKSFDYCCNCGKVIQ